MDKNPAKMEHTKKKWLSIYLWLWPPLIREARDGVVVRALASHQCGPGSSTGGDAICGFRFLLVLSLAPRNLSPSTPDLPSTSKTNISKFQLDQEWHWRKAQGTTMWMCYR